MILSKPHILALSDGRAGNVAMAEGLTAALAQETGGTWEAATIDPTPALIHAPPRLWSWLPASIALRQGAMPKATIIVGAGRRVAPLVEAAERAGLARGVQILDSGIAASRFAAVVTPEHDGLAGPNVVSTLGSVHRITPAILAEAHAVWHDPFVALPSPRIAVLLGGSTKRQQVTADRIDTLAADLVRLGGSLLVTASRRTGDENIARLRAALPDAWFWDGNGPNPYAGMLAWADAVIVSDDSVNMMSEAASCPAPVAVWPLLQESGKIGTFRAALYEAGVAAPFSGTLPRRDTPPLAETTRAAREVSAILQRT